MATIKWIVIMLLMCSSVFAHNHKDNISRDSVDLIEINHFYDEHGRLVFDQIIFYDWEDDVKAIVRVNLDNLEDEPQLEQVVVSRYQVRAWRLIKSPSQIPIKDWSDNKYSVLWFDGEQHIRYIKAKAVRETWTQHDPELVERDFLPKEQRRELHTIKVHKKN